jgi:hypothetical protein
VRNGRGCTIHAPAVRPHGLPARTQAGRLGPAESISRPSRAPHERSPPTRSCSVAATDNGSPGIFFGEQSARGVTPRARGGERRNEPNVPPTPRSVSPTMASPSAPWRCHRPPSPWPRRYSVRTGTGRCPGAGESCARAHGQPAGERPWVTRDRYSWMPNLAGSFGDGQGAERDTRRTKSTTDTCRAREGTADLAEQAPRHGCNAAQHLASVDAAGNGIQIVDRPLAATGAFR